MPETRSNVTYTSRSLQNVVAIKDYLLYYFTQREVNNFLGLLNNFEQLVPGFPEMYKKSSKNSKVRRAVLSKQLSVFYTIIQETITVVAVMDNRMSETKYP